MHTKELLSKTPNEVMREYEAYVARREHPLHSRAAKSLEGFYPDGKSVRERYLDTFTKALAASDLMNLARHVYRTPFQADRDRILYCGYFARLARKTQVVITRSRVAENRLSHTLKVEQVARAICCGLELNSDLAEAIALGHDLGHPPFGHAGETQLDAWVKRKIRESAPGLFSSGFPLLDRVDRRDQQQFGRCFTYGNDPGESFFQHGKQGVRLLTTHYKESVRQKFTSQVLFGIWRHSLRQLKIGDSDFLASSKDEFALTGEGRTLECEVVRYADDIASVYDLLECIGLGVAKAQDVKTELKSLDEAGSLGLYETHFLRFLDELTYGSIGPVLTCFISDMIDNSDLDAGQVALSPIGDALLSYMRETVKERVHSAMAKVDRLSSDQLPALAEWYFKQRQDFLRDYNEKLADPTFPYRANIGRAGRLAGLRMEDLNHDLVAASLIADFVGVLTDDEVRSQADARVHV